MRCPNKKLVAPVVVLTFLCFWIASPGYAQETDGFTTYTIDCMEFYGESIGAPDPSQAFEGALDDIEEQAEEHLGGWTGYSIETITLESVTVVENEDGSWSAFIEADVCFSNYLVVFGSWR